METIEVTPIAKLRPYTKAEKIKIRVCRIWKSSISATVRKYNNAVEASASGIDCELVASKIDASSCYEIMNFRTIKIREQYKVVPHKTQVIFTGTTLFKKLSTVFPPIPRHRFFLLDFNMLYPRLNRDDVLTDVIGHITAVQQLESKQINQRIVQKCDIHIEYIRKEELSVTLWADIAEAFCSLSIQKLSLPIIVVFTSLKVKIYLENIVLNSTSSSLFFIDPDIPEVNSYKSMYKVNLILEDSTNEISALIIGKAGEKLFGMPCKDLFLRLIGQKKIFHLRFGNRKNSFNSSDVLVYNVSDDTAIEPIAPQILPRAVTVSSTTVLSLTLPPETSGKSHKRKRESVRKALFPRSEQRYRFKLHKISEVDPKEFDEIPIKLLEKKKSPLASAKTDSPSKN
ncbi:hypothetical protein D8674_034278 [Pyrus ussuriensis x Pyrus communis]|uniref:DUF223 domain-containing protein n=1 Tax=Pyrus ussuriensis x Pyrus communis TaxID=2448454 RepID=A0A5N5HRZ7_9ROSA|nr:hypothetical protein D8674_034278 [Pyrus ussuriensis x Pyrus communis]